MVPLFETETDRQRRLGPQPKRPEPKSVVDMDFGQMARFFLKAAIAAIPALFVASLTIAALSWLASAFLVGLLAP